MRTLRTVCIKIRKSPSLALVTRASCSATPPTSGTRRPSTPTLITLLTSSARRWPSRERTEPSPGCAPTARPRSSLSTKISAASLCHSVFTTFLSRPSTTQASTMRPSVRRSSSRSSSPSSPSTCSARPTLSSTPRASSMSAAPPLMPVSLAARLSWTPTVAGLLMVVAPSPERTRPRSIGLLLTTPATSPSRSSLVACAIERSSRSRMRSALPTPSRSTLTRTAPQKTVALRLRSSESCATISTLDPVKSFRN
mmetsp:Transcript_46122/g.61075  ORF Transcript_46122/g.61075 Transcript_46122/m.61075 type:complete len:254 (-) Transcript_46122:284-1045(-)